MIRNAAPPDLPIRAILDGDPFGPYYTLDEIGLDLEFVNDWDPEYSARDRDNIPVRLIIDSGNLLFAARVWDGWVSQDFTILEGKTGSGLTVLAEIDRKNQLHRKLLLGSGRYMECFPSTNTWESAANSDIDLASLTKSAVALTSFSTNWTRCRLRKRQPSA